ncbi:MAG: hypothetical protein QXV93_00010 [Zestosphaera sp.]
MCAGVLEKFLRSVVVYVSFCLLLCSAYAVASVDAGLSRFVGFGISSKRW